MIEGKARMNRTLILAGPGHTFHKGTTYNCIQAKNQPNYKQRGLYFVEKRNGQSMLVSTVDGDITLL